uniref:Uncharacterized protein n=1 Tax=Anopheles atroparvus TaxID=41427 RepID=A0A182JAV4_ANOAO
MCSQSPPTPLSRSPPSASCSPPATGGFCASPQTFFPGIPSAPASAPPVGQNGGRMFFHPSTPGPGAQYPRLPSQPTPLSANSHSSSSGISSSLDTPSCSSGTPHYVQSQAQPVLFNWQDDGDSSESEGGTSSSQATSSSGCSPYCYGLDESESSSTAGSLTPSSAGAASAAPFGVTVHGVVPPHLDTYMVRRDQLQEFPGKIPQRKRRSRTPKPKKSRFLEKPLMWQMAVTAALIALGCGYFVGR